MYKCYYALIRLNRIECSGKKKEGKKKKKRKNGSYGSNPLFPAKRMGKPQT